jgi:hypothetical protein
MTHTLHRSRDIEGLGEDFAILVMATQGFNDRGAADKLRQVFRLVAESEPDNLADDNRGGRLTGLSDAEILSQMGDKAYIGAAFSDRVRLKDALARLKQADLGMSVVVTGDYDVVFGILNELGMEPHTVNMSLGVFGKKELLPGKEVLAVATMCGHQMVPNGRIEQLQTEVKSGRLSSAEAGLKLAGTCTCGIFNPVRAGRVLEKTCCQKGGNHVD